MQKLPIYILKLLDDNKIFLEKEYYFAKGDLSSKGDFITNYLIFDTVNLITISGKETLTGSKHAKKIATNFTIDAINFYKVAEIDSLKVEVFISSARLYADKNGHNIELNAFSLGVHKEFIKLERIFTAIKEDKKSDIDNILKDNEFDIYCPKCGRLYSEPERKICPHCMDKMSIAMRLMGFFKYYKKQVALVLLFMLISTGFSILAPFVSNKLLFDEVLTEGGSMYGKIAVIVVAIFAVRLIGTVITMLTNYTIAGVMPSIVYDIKLKIFSAMQNLSTQFYTSKQTGNLMARVNDDSNNIYWFFIDGLPYLIINVITFIGILTIMMLMNVTLALITVVIIPGIVLAFMGMSKLYMKYHHRNFIFSSAFDSFLSDTINGQRIVRSFAKEEEENERFRQINDDVVQNGIKSDCTELTFFPIIYLVMFLTQIVVTGVGGYMILQNKLDLGTLLTFIVYLGMLYGPLEFMSWVSTWWARCVDSSERMFEIIDAVPDIVESKNPLSKDTINGDVELCNVFFEYEPARLIIKDVSLKIKAGEMIGIVGKAGAGKSTIANLITRLYEVKNGAILIDGHNVKDYKIDVIRKNVGIVSQEIYLFMGTIAENIRYAKKDATNEEIIYAAKAAMAHDFIIKLADGYETKIGEGGQDLSGGERQRISIARTILQNPKILILDEATASMDTATERNIQKSIDTLKIGRTTIAIAHRLSTLRDADKIAVIEDGKLCEYGTHKELINKKGKFYDLYQVQTKALQNLTVGG
ncbi:MAG: ABC transporter ATP-binding protein [Clostridia bacterium]